MVIRIVIIMHKPISCWLKNDESCLVVGKKIGNKRRRDKVRVRAKRVGGPRPSSAKDTVARAGAV